MAVENTATDSRNWLLTRRWLLVASAMLFLWIIAQIDKTNVSLIIADSAFLKELNLVDKIVREPLGGAHRNPHAMAVRLKAVILKQIAQLEALPVADLLDQRYKRLRSYGTWQE